MPAARLRLLPATAALWAVLAGAGAASAEPAAAVPQAPASAAPAAFAAAAGQGAEANPDPMGAEIESTRRALRATVEWLARGVDGWFGDIPFDEGGRVSRGRLSVDWLHRADQGHDVSVRLNARLRLPNVERHAYLLVGRDNERDTIEDRPDTLTRQQLLAAQTREEQSFFAGLGLLVDAFDFRVGLRGGLKTYAQARYRQDWAFGEAQRVDFRQTFFWTADTRLGSTTALSVEHVWSRSLVLRWLGAATITERSRRYEWSNVFGAYRVFGPERLLSLELIALDAEGSGVDATDAGIRLRWQQPIGHRGLVGDVVVGRFWPRPDASVPRQRVWAVGAGLTLKF